MEPVHIALCTAFVGPPGLASLNACAGGAGSPYGKAVPRLAKDPNEAGRAAREAARHVVTLSG
jgi:hypothetical protein